MSQAHGHALWTEPAQSGATPSVIPAFLTTDGASGVTQSLAGTATYRLIDVARSGDYIAIDVATPLYLVSDGSGGLTHSLTGPATAILVDDGAGGVMSSADLTLTPIADLRFDTGGDVCMVLRAAATLDAVLLRGNLLFY